MESRSIPYFRCIGYAYLEGIGLAKISMSLEFCLNTSEYMPEAQRYIESG